MHIFLHVTYNMPATVSSITEMKMETLSCLQSAKCDDDDDEGEVCLYFGTCKFHGDSVTFSLNVHPSMFSFGFYLFIYLFFRVSSFFYISPRTDS